MRGIQLTEVNEVVISNNIEIKNFINLRTELSNNVHKLIYLGEEKEKISLTISNNKTKAYATFFYEPDELPSNEELVKLVSKLLRNNGVVYGINLDPLQNTDNILSKKDILLAEATPPVHGKDSEIKLFNVKEIKPKELEDGKVDHQDMGIINLVKVGFWLGEYSKPTTGIHGINVKGESISSVDGKLKRVLYDRKTVTEVEEENKFILRSKIDGAYKRDMHGMIGVSNHLVLTNVDYGTGNINFDGFVTVEGTIEDGFSVHATNDIEVRGLNGIGNIKEIISKEGDILIIGGINGKNSSFISGENIIAKYISGANILAHQTLKVKNYIFNSSHNAKEILMENPNSQIAGGEIKSANKIIVGYLGNIAEHKTIINVTDIDREKLTEVLQILSNEIEDNKEKMFKTEKFISLSTSKNDELLSLKFQLLNALSAQEKQYHFLKSKLSLKGDSLVYVKSKIYPGVRIYTKKDVKIFDKEISTVNIVSNKGILSLE